MIAELREHMALMSELDRLRVENAELKRKAQAQHLMDAANVSMGQMLAMRNMPVGGYSGWGHNHYPADCLDRGSLMGTRI